jgi:2-polyprenyl-3-methyl-5-hydroxy-6-metoxy-1,4-benzoquinol methylase
MKCHICQSEDKLVEIAKIIEPYRVLKCSHCSIEYISPIPTDDILTDYYSKYYLTRNIVDAKLDFVSMHQTIADYLSSKCVHNEKTMKVLDYGFGEGHFLKFLSGGNYQVYGYDISQQNVQQLTEYCQQSGCSIEIFSSIEKLIGSNHKYDLITLFQVIEHLNNPVTLVHQLSELQNQKGLLYIECPNNDALYLRPKDLINKLIGRRKFWRSLKAPEHIFGYNSKSISILLETAGYRIIDIGDYYYSDGMHQIESIEWWPPFYKNSKLYSPRAVVGSLIQLFDYFSSKLLKRGSGLYVLAEKEVHTD